MPASAGDLHVSPLTLPKGADGAFKDDPGNPFVHSDFAKNKDKFEWTYSDEPHATRRKQILAAHPEMRKLFGAEIKTFYIVMGILISQLWIASWIGTASWTTWLLVMYIYGATVNHSLQLASHEISHNLVFEGKLWANCLLGIVSNIPTGVPSSVTFRYYHMDHHQYQGQDAMDTDIPSAWELKTFTTTPLKLIWMVNQWMAYALRPVFMNPKPVTQWQVLNVLIVLASDAAILYYCGFWGFAYLVTGSLIGLGLHPVAGHFLAEHYVFVEGYETYSYYGCLNYVNFNVGYHNEHHDFPKIAWSRLPRVREIAPEWYEHLPHHDSYCAVIWNFITDKNIGPWSRVKRSNKRGKNSKKKM